MLWHIGMLWVLSGLKSTKIFADMPKPPPLPPGDNVQIHTKVVQPTHVRLKSIIKLSSKSFPITYFTDWVLSIHLCKHPTTFIMGPLSSAFDWTCSPSWVLCLPFSFIWEKVKNLINSQKLNIDYEWQCKLNLNRFYLNWKKDNFFWQWL